MKHKRLRSLILDLLIAAVLTVIAATGVLRAPDGVVSDALYQHRSATDGQIVILGMDQKALEVLGPMPWPREIMAQAIDLLNSPPEGGPAAIGIDVLFTGESDPESDAALADAVARGGNVVVAAAAFFGTALVETEDGETVIDEWAVTDWDAPYDALAAAAADTGHISVMADKDGILRRVMLYVDDPAGRRVLSFPRILYERWCAANGLEANPLPERVDGFCYLPFTGKPDDYYDGWSIADLLDGTLDPADFTGKIVLIGPYASAMQDEYRTSIAHDEPMYGIEIHANTIDAFRKNFLPRQAGDPVQLLVLFLVSFLAARFFRDRKVSQAVAAWLAACALWVGLCLALYRAGWVLHVLWVPLAVTVLFVASVAVNYVRAQQAKRYITNTFGRYVDPAILKQLLETGGEELALGGRTREIAVLFVDIRGFTTMSESLDPPTVVEIINRYLTLTADCIMRNHGTLDKFVGDCTMAFWNAPLPQEDPVYLACRTAMEMVEGSKAVGEELMQRFGRTVSFGVGIHVGPAVVGNIVTPRRMDYTAIGDTVNTASRLESNAPGGTIYISRAVADALGDRAKVTSLGGSIRLKGKAEGFEVLTLDALGPQKEGSQ